MNKKKSFKELVESVGEPSTTALAVSTTKKEKSTPPQMITFDRYFMSLGKPMHHKAGMVAYANTKGKKTAEAWDALFKNY